MILPACLKGPNHFLGFDHSTGTEDWYKCMNCGEEFAQYVDGCRA